MSTGLSLLPPEFITLGEEEGIAKHLFEDKLTLSILVNLIVLGGGEVLDHVRVLDAVGRHSHLVAHHHGVLGSIEVLFTSGLSEFLRHPREWEEDRVWIGLSSFTVAIESLVEAKGAVPVLHQLNFVSKLCLDSFASFDSSTDSDVEEKTSNHRCYDEEDDEVFE